MSCTPRKPREYNYIILLLKASRMEKDWNTVHEDTYTSAFQIGRLDPDI